MDYRCVIEFMDIKGECSLAFGENELFIQTLFAQSAIPYADISSFETVNHQLIVQTAHGPIKASKLGAKLTPFFVEFYEKYNEKVLKALFIDEKPMLETKGDFYYRDDGGASQGKARIMLFERCLCILPPNDGARRIALCFVRAVNRGDYRHTLTLDTGETYELARLGYDTDPFDNKLNQRLYAIRQNAVQATLKIDPSLGAMQSAQIAGLMPEGVAVPMGALKRISPSFTGAVEAKIHESRAFENYLHFKQVCDPDQILVGMKSYLAGEEEKNMLWIVAPKPGNNGGVAVVELILPEETAAASYVFKFSGEWESFYKKLNHAMEAVDFRREPVYLSDEELRRPDNAHYFMAVKRTAALQFLRRSFSGRIIHASLESWKKELNKHFS